MPTSVPRGALEKSYREGIAMAMGVLNAPARKASAGAAASSIYINIYIYIYTAVSIGLSTILIENCNDPTYSSS